MNKPELALPRVVQQSKEVLTKPVPRVRFEENEPKVREIPPQLVVAWPKGQIVQPKEQILKPKPDPILKHSKYIDISIDSIAARVQER